MKKQFDTTKPHYHYCPRWQCRKSVYCANKKCELPQAAECLECQRDGTTEKFYGRSEMFVSLTGYRRTTRRDDSY